MEAKVSAALPPLFVDCTVELPLMSVRPVMLCNTPAALFTLNVPLPDKNNAEPVTPFKLPVVPLPMFSVPPVIVTFVAPVVSRRPTRSRLPGALHAVERLLSMDRG